MVDGTVDYTPGRNGARSPAVPTVRTFGNLHWIGFPIETTVFAGLGWPLR